jgi:hypothetical protein
MGKGSNGVKYFHRTSASAEQVLEAAKAFFGGRLTPAEESPRRRVYHGALGRISISARAEGGHYTFVEVATGQVGESELDKLAKRFLAEVHRVVEPTHVMRGAY